MIAIKTKSKRQFPPASVGFIQIEIDLIQYIPRQNVYVLRIKDSCYIDGENGQNQISQPLTRFFTLTYDEIKQLANDLNIPDNAILSDPELFRQGLLMVTQQECQENKGRYFTQASDWEIVR
ncbi:hypothetical protein [Elizabethkingia ursingii]|uniref:hypothetical protein n=1 Tax=Elizabethkingia ursingii TaxID=1756150 RepID=UPI000AB661C3|nr:hypothetical protein [Elizabethkingia ursingii]